MSPAETTEPIEMPFGGWLTWGIMWQKD